MSGLTRKPQVSSLSFSKFRLSFIYTSKSALLVRLKTLTLIVNFGVLVVFPVVLAAPIELSLDDCVEYIQEDELVEVTPLSVRICKNPKMAGKKR